MRKRKTKSKGRNDLRISQLTQEQFRDMVERKMDEKQYERLYQQGVLRRVKYPLLDYIRRTGFYPPGA